VTGVQTCALPIWAALYRRRVLLGRGEPRRLAELERIAAGATRRATASEGSP
jgi:hypothetical protein